jgi:uncharacterized protein involved in copper resistance
VYILWTRRRRPAATGPMTSAPPPVDGSPPGTAAGSPSEAPQADVPEMDEIDKPLPPPPP